MEWKGTKGQVKEIREDWGGERLDAVYSEQSFRLTSSEALNLGWPFGIGLRWGDGPGACYSTLPSYWIQFSQGKGRDLG